MGYYKNPAEMFSARADKYKREGDRYWARAKNGDGDFFYGKARACYAEAARNKQCAEQAKREGKTWK